MLGKVAPKSSDWWKFQQVWLTNSTFSSLTVIINGDSLSVVNASALAPPLSSASTVAFDSTLAAKCIGYNPNSVNKYV